MADILVIEDDAILREAVAEWLRLAGYAVRTAADGNTGLASVNAAPPTLVVTDLSVPGAGGAAVIGHLRQHHPDTPIVAISGLFHSGFGMRADDAIALGAARALAKPFKRNELLGAIAELLDVAGPRAASVQESSAVGAYDTVSIANLLDLTHDAVCLRSIHGAIEYWNRAAEELYGWLACEAVGCLSHDLLRTVLPAPLADVEAELLHAGRWEGELLQVRKDGTPIVVASRWSLQRDQADAPIAILETSNDITDRKRAEEALRHSETFAHDLIETIPAMAWSALPDGSNVFVSRRWTEYTGLSAQSTAGWGWRAAVHPDDIDRHEDKWSASLACGESFEDEARFRRAADDEYRWFLVRGEPLRDEQGSPLKWYGILTDIEDRKRAEQAQRDSEEQWRATFESNPTMYFMVDDTGRILLVNSVGATQLGYAVSELVGQPVLSVFFEADRQLVRDNAEHCFQNRGETIRWEARKIRKDGRMIWVRETARAVLLKNRPVLLIVCEDVTEHKRAEAERLKLEERLRQAEKMEAIGRFASGIAHDFNNLLGGILGYGEMLFDEAPENAPRKRHAQNVITAAMRGRDLVEQILAYTRSQRCKRKATDVCRTVAETLELGRSALPRSITLHLAIPDAALVVLCDATQLHQVVMNLYSNAIHAMKTGGPMRVAVTPLEVGADSALSHGILRRGRYVRVSLEDRGCGMDETTLARIFEPFFTTKEAGGGTGLGLALVYAIVADCGGVIDVKSAPGEGSTFSVFLPLADATAIMGLN